MFHHGVQDGQQLAHASGQGHLRCFADSPQALVARLEHWIVADCNQCTHVQGGPHLRPPALDRAGASQRSAVPIEGSHADQGREALAAQRAQLRQLK